MKQIDREELQRGDGTDGNPALVAVEGKVRDVSSSPFWKDGHHINTHRAGQDLSVAIQAAPHGPGVLDRFEIVGEYVEERPQTTREFPEPPRLVRRLLDYHPHPISTHFPIGLGIAGSFFVLLSLIFDADSLGQAAFYNLILAMVAAPLSAGAGVLSWRYNYGGRWTRIFRGKFLLSILLIVILVSAVAVRAAFFEGNEASTVASALYYALALLVAPIVITLGRLGGKITFPS